MSILEKKVTRERFLELVMNNEDGLNKKEMATKLEISEQYFYKLLREYRIKSKAELKTYIEPMVPELIDNLRKSARKGSDRAAQLLLEMGEQYTPSNKVDLKGSMNINYSTGAVKTPTNAGVRGKNKESSEQI